MAACSSTAVVVSASTVLRTIDSNLLTATSQLNSEQKWLKAFRENSRYFSGLLRRWAMQFAHSAAGVSGGSRKPFTPSRTSDEFPPTSELTAGTPKALA